jgi:hypothetical protein
MSEVQSQRSVTSSTQHRQEAEVAAAEERERAAARLAMAELAAARAEVKAAAAADAARVTIAELEVLRGSSISISVSADDGTDDELKLAREVVREQVGQWAAAHPQRRSGGSPDGRGRHSGWGRARRPCPRRRRQPRQVRTCQRLGRRRSRPLQVMWLSLPGQVPWSPRDPGRCQGRRFRCWVAYPH